MDDSSDGFDSGVKFGLFAGASTMLILCLVVFSIYSEEAVSCTGTVERVEKKALILRDVKVKFRSIHEIPRPGSKVSVSKGGTITVDDEVKADE
ncbi:MAG: hypothetical protein ACRD1Z_11280 [Vicinamibacteria bacterium]